MKNSGEPQIGELANIALRYTGLVLTRSLTQELGWSCGAASAVYMAAGGKTLGISCRHVEANSDIWYVNSPAIEETREALFSLPASSPSWPMALWTAADLAVFAVDEARLRKNKRECLAITAGTIVQRDHLKPGTSAIITGIWAEQSQYEAIGDKMLFAPFPYTAKGEVTLVEEHRIVGRFEEHHVLVWDKKSEKLAAQLQPKGSSRNLKGMSGSGLWIPTKTGNVIFAGILRGPASGVVGDPDIAFTPVWDVVRLINLMWPTKPNS